MVSAPVGQPTLLGCDFTSSPDKRKPIVVALGAMQGARVVVQRLERFSVIASFGDWLAQEQNWLGGFDFPFGLPRELVLHLGWPQDWLPCMQHFFDHSRAELREIFSDFCNARPAGAKFAHRATDGPAGSSPSMKWVHPPVAWMMHAGVPLLLRAGAWLPGLREVGTDGVTTARRRIALEAYPGLLAREVLGQRSYKADSKAKQTPERLIARKDLITALEHGQRLDGQPLRLGLRLKLSHAQRDMLAEDASGDSLDAVLCLLQAAWAWQQHSLGAPRYGLPLTMDPLEGWIVSA